jgi:hypothetical protein
VPRKREPLVVIEVRSNLPKEILVILKLKWYNTIGIQFVATQRKLCFNSNHSSGDLESPDELMLFSS